MSCLRRAAPAVHWLGVLLGRRGNGYSGSDAPEEGDGGGEVSYEAGRVLDNECGGQIGAPARCKGLGHGGVSLRFKPIHFGARVGPVT